MEEEINVAKLLKDCPKGMELYSPMFGTVFFEGVRDTGRATFIDVTTSSNTSEQFYSDGKFNTHYTDSEVTLFPSKGKTWNGFVPPCKFKAGDVLVSRGGNIVLFSHIDFENLVHYHCIMSSYGSSIRIEENTSIGVGRYYECVLANEQQRQKMYDRIKYSGYKYNQQNNKLEKLIDPKFKVGNVIQDKDSYKVKITNISVEDETYGYESVVAGGIGGIRFDEQDEWELVPDKFDITTLVPFESRVLVRNSKTGIWKPAIWGFCAGETDYYYCVLGGMCWLYCIPFEGNEHLLGTTNSCDEFFITWKK